MKKEIKNEKLEKAILEILEKEKRSMSIREITNELKKRYEIKFSPQIVKKHLEYLKEKGEIEYGN